MAINKDKNSKTSQKILTYVEKNGQTTAAQLLRFLGITRAALHRHLSKLVLAGELSKVGRPPKVYYSRSKVALTAVSAHLSLSPEILQIITEKFLNITATGQREEGLKGFQHWCEKRGLPVTKTAVEYEQSLQKYARYKENGLIDGMYKLRHTFDHTYLDKLFYLDFYSIERFGKTKLGQLMLYAKQSQDRKLITELIVDIQPAVMECIKRYSVHAVGFIPPTVKREVQFMRELEVGLALPLPTITLTKVKMPITVPQKTLTKLEDRVENAKETIIPVGNRKYDTVLLIDDALGSGATLNETAKKIKEQGTAKKIIGLAITGSFSGFEVISEV